MYRTTNKVTKEFYIGVHSTYNLEDGYLGSGTKLWRRIQKYGRENFEKEILKFFNTSEEKFFKEKEIVNERVNYKIPSSLLGFGSKILRIEN